jgi:hypothetical protein
MIDRPGRQVSDFRRGLRRAVTGVLPLALFAALALAVTSQAAPVAEPQAEPEADTSGSTIFICDVGSDGTTTCVTIQGELEVCANLPAGIIRRSYLADPEQQPSVVPPTADDIDRPIAGITSGSQGSVVDVQEIYGPGEGTLDIVPAEAVDEFDDPAEQFQIEGVYKGDFTTAWEGCKILAAGQEITVFPGGFFSDVDLASDEMLDADRNLKILIALNTEGLQIDPLTATTPRTPAGQLGDGEFADVGSSDGTGGAAGGDGTGGTNPPPPGDFSAGGTDMAIVPDVLGMTLPAATAEINGAGFSVGNVTVQSADARPPGGLFIGSAHAQEEPTVVGQNPDGGEEKPRGSNVNLVMSGLPIAISEPSSLALLFLGLALLAMLLWVRRPQA